MLQIKYPLGDHKRHWIGEYQHLEIAVPSSPDEQTAIVTVLSDTDSLIEHLESLIAKEKAIKQGAMQELLTGKRRLPGFSGKWEMKKLIEILEFANGKPYETYVCVDGVYELITLDSIDIDGKLKAEHRRINLWDGSLKKDDIVMILSDIAHGYLLGLCDLIPSDNKFVLNQRVGRLRILSDDKPQYLRLQINARQNYFRSRGQGTSQRHIYKRDVNELEVPFPHPSEQVAIAQVLGDMDSEIDTLERHLTKCRMLKQGMMQVLLTGKVRII